MPFVWRGAVLNDWLASGIEDIAAQYFIDGSFTTTPCHANPSTAIALIPSMNVSLVYTSNPLLSLTYFLPVGFPLSRTGSAHYKWSGVMEISDRSGRTCSLRGGLTADPKFKYNY
ncbi:hypothetical protein AVEN_270962-1 [Araneus ventricosus]|uniref:Uncharacterized protein n=1 Tax=Araneus ventricosus TaxID=182803 RepID=A0A4Y2RXI1_ARAVE|nr:hypothetical protein AVEN_270962-1 [Araneus ventricosus]